MTHWPFHVSCFVLVWKVLVLYLGASQFIIDEFSFPFLASLLLSLKIQGQHVQKGNKVEEEVAHKGAVCPYVVKC